ncbi:Dirigent protein 1 [Bienertia sinuspersici]
MALTLFSTVLSILLFLAFPTSQLELHDRNCIGLRSLHLSIYLHETFNMTAYVIEKGVSGDDITTKSSPYGSLMVYNDLLSETPNRNARAVGHMEGSGVTTGFDSDRVTSVIRTTLKLKGYKGELLNVGAAYYAQLSEYPIVGGTGDFRFVQGYMTTSVVDINHPTTCYKVDFYLF